MIEQERDGQFVERVLVGEPDIVLQGQYWGVNCYQLAKNQWHLSPFGDPFGRLDTAETDEETIAHIISTTPLADNLINIVNIGQVILWLNYRDRSTVLALCFRGEPGTDNDPLLKQLEAGEI